MARVLDEAQDEDGLQDRTYDPDVVVRPVGERWAYDERRPGSVHDLHPAVALLLSTSGSTGSPKMVGLSYGDLRANAVSIAMFLGIDRGRLRYRCTTATGCRY